VSEALIKQADVELRPAEWGQLYATDWSARYKKAWRLW
jgi:hypothetical protein